MLKAGTRLNNTYVVIETIGAGGGGVVYKAYHERLQTYVVVKQIKDQVKGILESRAEADILKRIKHTNLPRVYDFLEIEGEVYTVMDFVPGSSLDKVVASHGYFDSKCVYQWALQLADALAYLHKQEPPIIHSDIKPANIMLTPEGNVCLIDFNISLAFDNSKRMSSGISGGYSPPEQHPSQASYWNQVHTASIRAASQAAGSRPAGAAVSKPYAGSQAGAAVPGQYAGGQAGAAVSGQYAGGQAGAAVPGQYAGGRGGAAVSGQYAGGQAGAAGSRPYAGGQAGAAAPGQYTGGQAGGQPYRMPGADPYETQAAGGNADPYETQAAGGNADPYETQAAGGSADPYLTTPVGSGQSGTERSYDQIGAAGSYARSIGYADSGSVVTGAAGQPTGTSQNQPTGAVWQPTGTSQGQQTGSVWQQAGTSQGQQTGSVWQQTGTSQGQQTQQIDLSSSTVTSFIGRGIDERSDIYSLGATLYHLLTGMKPSLDFDAIIPIRDFDIKIGEGFLTILEKMMEFDPDKRYQNGAELKYALEHIYELDSEYKRYRRKARNRKIMIAFLYAAGLALTAGGAVTYRKEQIRDYNKYVQDAGNLIEKGDFEEAEPLLDDAFRIDSGRAEAHERKLYMLYADGQYEECVDYGLEVLDNPLIDTDSEEAEQTKANMLYLIGNAYFEQEDYNNAVNFFDEAIDLNKKNSLYFRDYAISLAKTGNVDQADDALGKAIDLGLGEDSIYMVQGEIAVARGNDEEAVEHLRRSVRTASDDDLLRRATILCAQTYKRLGDAYIDDEIELLEGAENSFSLNVSMHISEQLADAYARKAASSESFADEYYGKALGKFEELYDKGYSTRQMMENIAILYQETGEYDEAAEMLLEMADQYPNDYRAYKRLAILEAEIQSQKINEDRDYHQMKDYYETAMELYEGSDSDGDTEMQMLETMMRDLEDGGWFAEER